MSELKFSWAVGGGGGVTQTMSGLPRTDVWTDGRRQIQGQTNISALPRLITMTKPFV